MSAKTGVKIFAIPQLSDGVFHWIRLGSRPCMVKLKVKDRPLCLLLLYVPNTVSKYYAFVNDVNDII